MKLKRGNEKDEKKYYRKWWAQWLLKGRQLEIRK